MQKEKHLVESKEEHTFSGANLPKTLATTTTYEAYDSLNVPSNHQPESLSQYAAKSALDRKRLLVALDFSFFTRIYNAYPTIW